jgi:membrane-bound lytic murein transglycosylase B
MIRILCCLVLICSTFTSWADSATPKEKTAITHFIDNMVKKHHFNRQHLQTLLGKLTVKHKAINAMNKPYEAKPWHKYQPLFVTESRILGGVKFWHKYRNVLKSVSAKTGVPPQIIVAIIGVESRYGKHKGNYPTLQALYTFAFFYPRREKFFTKELTQFLLLCREQGWNPLDIKGSYAGAMGQPQFMPSSYRAYGLGYAKPKQVNLFNSEPDVIASVANYFVKNGWQKNQPITTKVTNTTWLQKPVPIASSQQRLKKPLIPLTYFTQYGVDLTHKITGNLPAMMMQFSLVKGKAYWLGFQNFYVITRYNTSILYSLAVVKLSRELAKRYQRDYPN